MAEALITPTPAAPLIALPGADSGLVAPHDDDHIDDGLRQDTMLNGLQVQVSGIRTVRLAMSPFVSGQVVVLEPVAAVTRVPVAATEHVGAATCMQSAGSSAKAPLPEDQAKANSDLDALFKS